MTVKNHNRRTATLEAQGRDPVVAIPGQTARKSS